MVMANLSSLPFEVHLLIARHLSLKDALSYAEILPITYDAVYYIFAHRKQLDFASTLNSHGIIDLSDITLLQILHAHTRATEVRYFAPSPTFQRIDELKFFMDLYWSHTFIPVYDDDLQPSLFSGHYVGHPSGHLTSIRYAEPLNPSVYRLFQNYDDQMYGVFIDSEPSFSCVPSLSDSHNWSVIDIDEPYAKCIRCDTVIKPIPWPQSPICSSCESNHTESTSITSHS